MLYNQSYFACEECDALLELPSLRDGQKVECPRCGHLLFRAHPNAVDRGLALSVATLILMLPAMTLPIMSFGMLGQEKVDTMIDNVVQLFQQGFWWMGFLVLLCSLVAPVAESCLILGICLFVKLRRAGTVLTRMLKWQTQIRRWVMLDVYLLSIVVAYIKLVGDGEVTLGYGLACFVMMLVVASFNGLTFDSHYIWEWVGAKREDTNQKR